MVTMLRITPSVKAIEIQRWACRTHWFQFKGTSSAAASGGRAES
jgi:hypothetical protein